MYIYTMTMYKYNRIKIVLVEKEKLAKELAEHLKVNNLTVSRWNKNKSQPSIETLFRIAEFLNVPVCKLLNEDYKENTTNPK